METVAELEAAIIELEKQLAEKRCRLDWARQAASPYQYHGIIRSPSIPMDQQGPYKLDRLSDGPRDPVFPPLAPQCGINDVRSHQG